MRKWIEEIDWMNVFFLLAILFCVGMAIHGCCKEKDDPPSYIKGTFN